MPDFSGLVLPPVAAAALLLDLDGTLLDIAPTPDDVVVPADLLVTLTSLHYWLGGALAVISGRPVGQVDGFLRGIPHAISGEHGGAIRPAPHAPIERPDLPAAPPEWLAVAEAVIAVHPGCLLERKARGFVLHYRLAPEAGPAMHAALAPLVATRAADFVLMAAHMAWEVRPSGVDKASAVCQIMGLAPFVGRRPVFIGDDVTDRDAMSAAEALGGIGLFVPDWFGDAAGVRAWLAAAARDGDWPR